MCGTIFLVDFSVFKDTLRNYDFYVHLSTCVSGFVEFFACGSVAEFFHRDSSPNIITCRAAHRSTSRFFFLQFQRTIKRVAVAVLLK